MLVLDTTSKILTHTASGSGLQAILSWLDENGEWQSDTKTLTTSDTLISAPEVGMVRKVYAIILSNPTGGNIVCTPAITNNGTSIPLIRVVVGRNGGIFYYSDESGWEGLTINGEWRIA